MNLLWGFIMVNVSSQTEVKKNLDVFSEIRSLFFYNKPETFRWYLYTIFFSLLLAVFLMPLSAFAPIISLLFLKRYFVTYLVYKYILKDEKQEILGVKIFKFKKDVERFSHFYITYMFIPFYFLIFIGYFLSPSVFSIDERNFSKYQEFFFMLPVALCPIFFISSVVYYLIVCEYMKTKFITEALKENVNLKDLDLNLFYSEARNLLVENVIKKD